jgi:hypothetical protein
MGQLFRLSGFQLKTISTSVAGMRPALETYTDRVRTENAGGRAASAAGGGGLMRKFHWCGLPHTKLTRDRNKYKIPAVANVNANEIISL